MRHDTSPAGHMPHAGGGLGAIFEGDEAVPDLERNSHAATPGVVLALGELGTKGLSDRAPGECAEVLLPRAPTGYDDWLVLLGNAAGLVQFGILLAWGCQHELLHFGQSCAGPVQTPGRQRRSGELFPLPVEWPADFPSVWQRRYAECCIDFSVKL